MLLGEEGEGSEVVPTLLGARGEEERAACGEPTWEGTERRGLSPQGSNLHCEQDGKEPWEHLNQEGRALIYV